MDSLELESNLCRSPRTSMFHFALFLCWHCVFIQVSVLSLPLFFILWRADTSCHFQGIKRMASASALRISDAGCYSALNELPPLHVLHITNGKSRPRGKVKLNSCRSLSDVLTITFNVIWCVLAWIGVSLRSSPGNRGAPDELSVCRRPYQAASATRPQIELINCVCLGFFMRHDLW